MDPDHPPGAGVNDLATGPSRKRAARLLRPSRPLDRVAGICRLTPAALLAARRNLRIVGDGRSLSHEDVGGPEGVLGLSLDIDADVAGPSSLGGYLQLRGE